MPRLLYHLQASLHLDIGLVGSVPYGCSGRLRRYSMDAKQTTAAIILAAGSSSRMGAGRHKLLLPLAGRPVLVHVIDVTLASQARPIVIVLGHQAKQVRAHLAHYVEHPNIIITENPDYLQGMSTSMHMGLRRLMANEQTSSTSMVDSALIMLGDQPLITPQVIDKLITTRRIMGLRIGAPLYDGKRGNPVLFDASLFAELLTTRGDEGGRSVIERHRQELATVEVSDPMTNYDVDTWEEYQRLLQASEDTG
jgi:molybdenum cofactor cytidylyltransferase